MMKKRYQVLARRYRPQLFKEVVGQDAAITTLKNALKFEKVAHAYLFCGTRGVGKTTLARLFAKALNCERLTQETEPCNQCSSCREILSGQSLDVIEIDGASNRGIDDIRKINETVAYAPSHGKYKIYIIDEVHMLTKEAFNALLKTLEEPPEKVKFFFATTEPHKILPTVLSRCQRFDLARIKDELIAQKLTSIALDLEKEAEPAAIELIAAASEGSLRDAESLFDQLLCFSETAVSERSAREILGLAPQEFFLSLDEAFSSHFLPFAFECVAKLLEKGKNLAHFFEELIEHYRNIVYAKCTKALSPSAKNYTRTQALYILDLLLKEEVSFQKSSMQRVFLESTLLHIIRSKNRIPVEVLVRHLTENQEKLPLPPFPQSLEKEEMPPPLPSLLKEEPPAKVELPLLLAEQETKLPPPSPPLDKKIMQKKEDPPEKPSSGFSFGDGSGYGKGSGSRDGSEYGSANAPPSLKKHPSHYDTIMRFTAIELEGTLKK